MNDLRTEDDLRAALDDLSLDAPVIADLLPSTVGRRQWSRRLRRWAPVAAGATIVALAAGLTVGLSRHGRSGPPAAGHANDLVGVQWQVRNVAGSRIAEGFGLRIEPNGRFAQNIGGCSSLHGLLSITPTQLKIRQVQLAIGLCPIVAGSTRLQQQQSAAVKAMLTGTVSWSIHDGLLTLRKDGVAPIVYRRSANSPAQTRQWSYHGVGISLPASWPANALRCATPITNTVIFPGPVDTCAYARPPGVTSVQFGPDDPAYNPFPTPPPGQPGTFLIDGVEASEFSSDPTEPLQVFEVRIPSRNVTVTITSPSRTEAANLMLQLYITGQ